ncbi:MAG: hypothetical protein KDD45_09360, partial [Bdellovibrionales bacterium]|nr:hypothetical protein [Bdellovibrionales bacterium]
ADLEKLIGSDLVIQTAYDALNQFNWSEQELLSYEQEVKRVRDNIAALEYQIDQAEARGEARGEAKGIAKEKIEIAKAMLLDGDSIEKVAKITGLTINDIQKLIS